MAQSIDRNHAQRGNHKQSASMTLLNPQRHVVPTAVLTQSKLVPITAVRPVTTVVPKPTVTRPRQAKTIVTKPNSSPRRYINRSLSPKASNFPPKVTAVKTPMVNAAKSVQGKWEWKPKCPILDHVFRNTSASMTLKRTKELLIVDAQGAFMPPKPDLVFHNAPNDDETVHTAFNVELGNTKHDNDLSHTHRPSAPIIEDWVFDSEDESDTKISHNVPSFV
nr:hypothetical protein [Tanacetum cinerariifolium]